MLQDNISKYNWRHEDIFSVGEFDFTRAFLHKNYSIGMHTHDFYELNIVMNGSGVHYINENSFPTQKGDVFVIPPNIPHGYSETDKLDVYHILIHTIFLEKYAKELESFSSYYMFFIIEPLIRSNNDKSMFLMLSSEEYEKTAFILKELDALDSINSLQSIVSRNIMVLSLLLDFFNYYQKNIDFSMAETYKSYNEIVKSLKTIFNNYHQKLSIELLAKDANLSRTAFINKFKQVFHVSPGEFILNYRISKAKSYLLMTTKSISEISEITGFYDLSHFIRAFKKTCGIAPADFKKHK